MAFKNRNSWHIVRSVLFALVLREIQVRIFGRRFGAFWTLLEPMLQIFVFLLLFSFRNVYVSGIDYPAYLVSGMIPFFMMRNICTKGMQAVNANKALFAYKQIKPLDTVIARCIVEVMIYLCIYFLFMVVMRIWFNMDLFMAEPLRWISVLLISIIFSFALGLLFCMLIEILPEFATFVSIFFMLIYFVSGAMFPIWNFPEEVLSVILWNPFVHIIDELRLATFPYYPQHVGVSLTYPATLSVILLFAALGLYRVRRLKLVAA